jgi:hypothetical protein
LCKPSFKNIHLIKPKVIFWGQKRRLQGFVWVSEGNRPFGRRRHRGKDIKIDLQGTELDGVEWIYLAQEMDKMQALKNASFVCLNIFGGFLKRFTSKNCILMNSLN